MRTTMTRPYRKIECSHWKKDKPPYVVDYHKFTYFDIEFDKEGWADPSLYLPLPFDLVVLKLRKENIMGWWNGAKWDGYKLRDCDKVFYWKKSKYL